MNGNPDRTPVDMSPEAIDLRIRELSQLWKLAMSLQTARRLGTVAELEAGRAGEAGVAGAADNPTDRAAARP